MKLFSEDMGLVEANAELLVLQKRFSKYDPSYICQATISGRRHKKEWMEILWQQYEQYADPHFVEDFRRQFSQRAWELYLGGTLLNRGFKLGQHNRMGPDFDLRDENNNRLTWIEAIAPEHGTGDDRVPDTKHGVVVSVPEEEMLLRIANALTKKYQKYQLEVTKGVVKKHESYVIAVNRSNAGDVDPELPLILKAVFGIGHQTLRINVDGVRQEDPEVFWSGRPTINKRSGKDVQMLFFQNPLYSGISAVIYCIDNILNSPNMPEEMGENFVIVHNPLAKNPLPVGFFPFGDEYKVENEHINKIRKMKEWTK